MNGMRSGQSGSRRPQSRKIKNFKFIKNNFLNFNKRFKKKNYYKDLKKKKKLKLSTFKT